MKKLMIAAIAAVSTAFGLHAAGFVAVGENFNEATDLSMLTDVGESTLSTTLRSFSKETTVGAPNMFYEQDDVKNVNVKTALTAPAWYSLKEAHTIDNQFYFDGLVKFTACDEDASVPTGSNAKIMVWTKEMTSGDTVTGTNLMVTAGLLGGDEPTAKIYDCGSITTYGIVSDSDWCRLTIKAVADISNNSSQIPGFVVFVNGIALTIGTTYREIGINESGLARNMVMWKRNNHLFPSLVAQNISISGVGFAGQGCVDDLTFSEAEPQGVSRAEFAADTLPAIATVNGSECTDVAAINSAIKAATGATTVQLLENITGDLTFEVAQTFTLDLNGKTLTGAVLADSGATLTIQSATGTIVGAVTIGRDTNKITLASGKIDVANNPVGTCEDNVQAPANYDLATADGWWTVVAEDGSAAHPFKIANATDLKNKLIVGAAGAGKIYKQTADFALTDVAGIGGYGKDSIGDAATFKDIAFCGTYDGNGKTITGVMFTPKVDSTAVTNKYCGFFNSAYGATIKNVKFGVANYGWKNVGKTHVNENGGAIVVGTAWNTTFENVEVIKGANAGEDQFYGTHALSAFAGFTTGTNTFVNCTNYLDLVEARTSSAKVAAFSACNQNNGAKLVFQNCANKGDITSVKGDWESAFAAYNDGIATFQNCSNTGNLTTDSSAKKPYQFCAFGSQNAAEVTNNGGCTGLAGILAVSKVQDGFNFATVADGVATFKANSAVASGDRVMAAGAPVVLATVGDTITLDETLAKATVTTTAADAYVDDNGAGTYTVTAKAEITVVATIANPVVEYTAEMTFPTPTVTTNGAETADFTTVWSPDAITEPEAGATNTYTVTVNVAAGEKTKAGSTTATLKVWKAAAPSGVAPGGSPVDVTAKSADAATNGVEVVASSPDVSKVSDADYKGYFYVKATDLGGGSYRLTAELKPEIVKAEKPTESLADSLSAVAAGTKEAAVVTNAKPGLWYSVKYTDAVGSMGSAAEGDRAQANAEGSVTIPMPKTSSSAAAQFYQIQVNTTDKDVVK